MRLFLFYYIDAIRNFEKQYDVRPSVHNNTGFNFSSGVKFDNLERYLNYAINQFFYRVNNYVMKNLHSVGFIHHTHHEYYLFSKIDSYLKQQQQQQQHE